MRGGAYILLDKTFDAIFSLPFLLYHSDHNDIKAARQATLPRGSFWQAKPTTSDDLRTFSSHVIIFHDLRMTLMTNGDDILTTLKTNGEDTLTTPMTDGEDTLTTTFITHNYLVTTMHDITDDPCDDIDNLDGILCPHH